jgi:hypothetical protein
MPKQFRPPKRLPKVLVAALDLMRSKARKHFEPLDRLERRHIQHVHSLFRESNVIGVGISEKETDMKGTGVLGLCFYVEKKRPKARLSAHELIPPVLSVNGRRAVFTDVQEIGKIRIHANVQRTPIESGYSVGSASDTGTLGAIVKKGPNYFLLSNSHVIARSGRGKIGDEVIYPGPDDLSGDQPQDVATLSQIVSFKKKGFVNLVDAALAQVDAATVPNLDFSINGAKAPLATVDPYIGMNIIMRGRTSGVSKGTVKCTTFTYALKYPGVGMIGFTDQVLCSQYADPGDSGALIVDQASGKIVGLHCGGGTNFSFFNPISAVISALNFSFAQR